MSAVDPLVQESSVQDSSQSNGPTRRDFIVGAAATGAALAGGCAGANQSRRQAVEGQAIAAADPGSIEVRGPAEAAPHARPTCVAIVPNKRAVTCDDAGKVVLWGLDPIREIKKLKMQGSKGAYVTVGVPGGTAAARVFCGCFDGKVYFWNLDPDSSPPPFEGHVGNKVEVWAIAVSPDGSQVISVDNGGVLIHWTVAADGTTTTVGRVRMTYAPIGGLAFVSNSQFLATHSHGRMTAWNLQGLQHVATLDHGTHANINSVAFAKLRIDGVDKNIAVTGGFDTRVVKWELALPIVAGAAPAPQALYTHMDRVWRVALSPDGRVASAGEDEFVQVRPIGGPPDHSVKEDHGVMGVAYSPETQKFYYTTGTTAGPAALIKELP